MFRSAHTGTKSLTPEQYVESLVRVEDHRRVIGDINDRAAGRAESRSAEFYIGEKTLIGAGFLPITTVEYITDSVVKTCHLVAIAFNNSRAERPVRE
jgi:hypothetical protein